MIPLLAIPVLNHPELLEATVRSIDHPVRTLLVIDNSPELGMGDVAEAALPGCVEDLVVVEPPRNLGVAASWNFAIRSYPELGWWCLVNADVEFAPGALDQLAEAMKEPGLRCLVEFAAFGISSEVIDIVGWFDENFVPIYAEDTDYRYRAKLAHLEIVDLANDSGHVGSVSYKDNEHARDNARTYTENVAYYRSKWGGWQGSETFTTPFGAPALGIDYWRLNRARLAHLAWRERPLVTA